MMRSRDEIETHLLDCRRRLREQFFGGAAEHLRYYRTRVDFLEWVLGQDSSRMELPNQMYASQTVRMVSAKRGPPAARRQ